MTRGIVIRTCEERDIEAVIDIEKASFSDPWVGEAFYEVFNSPLYLFLVCIDLEENELVGFVIGFSAADEAEIADVAVRADRRGCGIGGALVGEYLKMARERGAKRCFLEVRASNNAARALYERFGFVSFGVRKNYYKRPKEDALMMACELEENDGR